MPFILAPMMCQCLPNVAVAVDRSLDGGLTISQEVLLDMSTLQGYVVQELRNLLAVHGRELVMIGKASGAKKQQQFDILEKVFHGTESHASIVDLLIKGRGPYEHLYDVYDTKNNREGNEHRHDGKMRELRELFHCKIGMSFVVYEGGFDREAIAVKDGEKLTGRNLNDRALKVVQNYKHALRFYKDYAHTSKEEGVNPSGQKVEDMIDYVRKKMYVELKGAKDGKGSSRTKGGKEKAFEEDDMPSNYVFTGMFAFILFGPLGLAKQKLSCLSEKGEAEGVEPGSRQKARKAEAAAKKIERECSTEGYAPEAYRRGIPIQQKAVAAHLAVREVQEQKQNIRELLFIASNDHSNLLEELKSVNSMIMDGQRNPGLLNKKDEKYLQKWKLKVFKGLQDVDKRKRKLQLQSNELMSRATKKQVTSFYDQVGSFGDTNEQEATAEEKEPATPQAVTPRARLKEILDRPTPNSNGDSSDDSSVELALRPKERKQAVSSQELEEESDEDQSDDE